MWIWCIATIPFKRRFGTGVICWICESGKEDVLHPEEILIADFGYIIVFMYGIPIFTIFFSES